MSIREGWNELLNTPMEIVIDVVVLFTAGFAIIGAVLIVAVVLWSD
jgi:hypothetical protein